MCRIKLFAIRYNRGTTKRSDDDSPDSPIINSIYYSIASRQHQFIEALPYSNSFVPRPSRHRCACGNFRIDQDDFEIFSLCTLCIPMKTKDLSNEPRHREKICARAFTRRPAECVCMIYSSCIIC